MLLCVQLCVQLCIQLRVHVVLLQVGKSAFLCETFSVK